MIYTYRFLAASAVIAFALVSFAGCHSCGGTQSFSQNSCPNCAGSGQGFQSSSTAFSQPQFAPQSQGSGTSFSQSQFAPQAQGSGTSFSPPQFAPQTQGRGFFGGSGSR